MANQVGGGDAVDGLGIAWIDSSFSRTGLIVDCLWMELQRVWF